MKSWFVGALAIFVVGVFCMSEAHAEWTPKEILRFSDEARGNLQGVTWELQIHSIEKGREQDRTLEVDARGYDFLATMKWPAKVKGQKILMIDHNMWFAKPGVRKPVPVSPRQKLVGGAAYGDIAATNFSDDYEATPLPDEEAEGELCFVFDLKAKTEKATYDGIKYWVSKKRFVGVKAEFFTVSEKMLKSATFEYNKTILIDQKKQLFISKMTIVDALISQDVTTMEFNEPLLKEIPSSRFDLNFLMMR